MTLNTYPQSLPVFPPEAGQSWSFRNRNTP
jgi:hypothetical protein